MIDEHERERPNRAERAYDETTSASVAIVLAVLELEGKAPGELEFTLYEYVNPDALDALAGAGDGAGFRSIEIEFAVESYDVRVTADGRISVTERAR